MGNIYPSFYDVSRMNALYNCGGQSLFSSSDRGERRRTYFKPYFTEDPPSLRSMAAPQWTTRVMSVNRTLLGEDNFWFGVATRPVEEFLCFW